MLWECEEDECHLHCTLLWLTESPCVCHPSRHRLRKRVVLGQCFGGCKCVLPSSCPSYLLTATFILSVRRSFLPFDHWLSVCALCTLRPLHQRRSGAQKALVSHCGSYYCCHLQLPKQKSGKSLADCMREEENRKDEAIAAPFTDDAVSDA